MDRVMTAFEAAHYLGMHFRTVYRLARQGRLPTTKVGSQWRFQREILDQWLRDRAEAHLDRTDKVVGQVQSVLVVDDDTAVRDFFSEILALIGYRVVTAPDGHAALDCFRRQHFDFVFLDVLLPGLSGVDTLRGLQEWDPSTRVVIITGYPEHHLVAEALALGPIIALRKPLLVRDILNVVALLGGHRIGHEARRC